MKMFYIWVTETIECYFASLSIDIFVFFTLYSSRYLSLKLYIPSITCCCNCTKCMGHMYETHVNVRDTFKPN